MSHSGRIGINRLTVVLGVGLAAAWLALWQQWRWRESRRHVERLMRRTVETEDRLAEMRAELQGLKLRVQDQIQRNGADAARLERDGLAWEWASAAETWSHPPSRLPDWNPGSPFIWLNKTSLPGFGMKVFEDDGNVTPEFAGVIGLTPSEQSRLHAALADLLGRFQALECSRAVVSDEVPSGISAARKDVVTVRVPAIGDEGARFLESARSVLVANLGEDRGRLVSEVSQDWLSTQFNPGGTESRMISVGRLPDGTFFVNSESPSTKSAVSGATDVERYIPPHLRPLFNSLLGTAAHPLRPSP